MRILIYILLGYAISMAKAHYYHKDYLTYIWDLIDCIFIELYGYNYQSRFSTKLLMNGWFFVAFFYVLCWPINTVVETIIILFLYVKRGLS